MSKMRMPEMDVVRFQESDVIVASLGVKLINFGNGINGDAAIYNNGTTYEKAGEGGGSFPSNFIKAFNSQNGTNISTETQFAWKDSAQTGGWSYATLDNIISQDNQGSTSSVDGPYIFNFSNGNFEKQ